ncbi:hypothetical protein [Natrialba aegyptia]|uniref:Uncharacterized protein n=1 Tax=Natrialba aegyptia DSM 13077 TaxID=1227491 RepID=M0BHW0_9EURY|nr:hypothetical protein [Natrialba aegyptia]ELZ10027.1 hypothetical protein C480_01812 [Natrialba aegyptia DSM 13077]
MLVWDAQQDGLSVTDSDTAALAVTGTEFSIDEADPTLDVPRPVDETVAVTARELRLPHAVVYAFPRESSTPLELDPCGDPLSLSPGEYVVDVDTEIKTYLQFAGAARIERTDDFESVVVSFPERTHVILGFRSRHEFPTGTITVPDSPAALARAISHLPSSHKTTGPDRSYPTLRGHPPLLEPGDELAIPDRVRADTPRTGTELVVPPEYESLYVTAPLAYYLQARVRTDPTISGARLRLPEYDVERSLPGPPRLEREVEQLLRQTFFLDCLVRNAGPYGTELDESRLLEILDLDSESLYAASPQDRLATYLDVPFGAIEHRLPDWHLATYVAPEFSRVETLPFLLNRMSLLYRPRTSTLEGRELVERSLEAFYRDGERAGTGGQVASVDIVKPELRHGRAHGWLADGVPVDVFTAAPEAYHNRLAFLDRTCEETSVCVVLNDPDMAGEHDDVAEIYRSRSGDLPMTVTVEDGLTTAELARVFETGHDFVHYIGHCETDGLCCPDGTLSTASLDRCTAQTFFLNACGSFYEGRALIEKGSVAGAVTVTEVLNEHAIKVGSTFATLLVNGFSIERAMELARRRIMMGKDYTVVGDGTHSLTQGEHRVPTTLRIDELDAEYRRSSRAIRNGDPDASTASAASAASTASNDTDGTSQPQQTARNDQPRYLVTFDCYSTRVTGSYYFPHTADNEVAYLCGSESNFIVSKPELVTLLKETEASVIYDGDIYWSNSLWSHFDE